jgi:hypothetical protein
LSNVNKILDSFTQQEREALDEYYRKKLGVFNGRSTQSRKIYVISDLHVGSSVAVYSGYGGHRISKDQQKLRDFWLECRDQIGDIDLLLINGEPINGPNPKQNGYENWTSDVNAQIDDAQRLIRELRYDLCMMTRGSGYHTQSGWTNYEETLAAKLNIVPYQGMFGEAMNVRVGGGNRTALLMQYEPAVKYEGVDIPAGYRTDFYVFFEICGVLFNATHHIGYNRWEAYRTTALARELAALEFARGKYYQFNRDLDVTIRSHVHYFVEVRFSGTRGFTTPAWKYPDMHLFRGGLGGTYPSVGGIEITVEQNGKITVDPRMMPIKKLPKPNVKKLDNLFKRKF